LAVTHLAQGSQAPREARVRSEAHKRRDSERPGRGPDGVRQSLVNGTDVRYDHPGGAARWTTPLTPVDNRPGDVEMLPH
jgi:hypothetical protein